MGKTSERERLREMRRKRVRRLVRGSDMKPRLCVYRSNLYTYAQLISDESGKVIGAVSSKTLVAGGKGAKTREQAKRVGLKVAELAKAQNIESVVFDRNGYIYHGRVAAVAEGAREGGLKF